MKPSPGINVSVVVPVYNSASTLPNLTTHLSSVLREFGSYEIILVDDDSKDGSWETLKEIAKTSAQVKAIKLNRNFGQQSATLCGIRSSAGDIVITIDDDLQYPPSEIPKLLNEIRQGYDVVYGVPAIDHQSFYRRIGSTLIKWSLSSIFGANYARNISSFRAFKGRLRSAFATVSGPFVLIDVSLSWSTTKVKGVKVDHRSREAGKSSYSFLKLFNHAVSMVVGYSILPLRFSTIIGSCVVVFGIGVLFYVIGSYFLYSHSVPGFPFLASIIAIFAGSQLFSVGIIGEYVARIYLKQLGQPEYIIHEEL